jgi:hypothetical protein
MQRLSSPPRLPAFSSPRCTSTRVICVLKRFNAFSIDARAVAAADS